MLSPIIEQDVLEIISDDLDWENLRNKSILVTGANGFLPSYIVHTFSKLNQIKQLDVKIFALVRNKEKAEQRFEGYLNSPSFKLIIQDVVEPIKIEQKIDYIIHAASQASPKYYKTDPVGTLTANSIGTNVLLEFAVKNKAEKFLYFSSSEVYGNLENPSNISETDLGKIDSMELRSCYAEGKRVGETLCIAYANQYNLHVNVVRPFHTYGPGFSLDDGRVFADFVNCVVNDKDIVMNSDGSATRSFCYLSDATKGFLRILLQGENKQAYNLGNANATSSIKELAETIISLVPEKKLKAVFNVQQNDSYLKSNFNVLCPNTNKLEQLGWLPKVDLKEGFRRTISYYENLNNA
jgi:UDP-glucuronate decarboxylase